MRTILGNRLMASAVAFLLMGLLPLPASAGFVTFQAPVGGNLDVSGINDAGTVTGFYGLEGFVRDASGNFTSFTVPGLASTTVTGINNYGTVVGYNTLGYGPGFLRDAAGNITTFQIPGLSSGLAPRKGLLSRSESQLSSRSVGRSILRVDFAWRVNARTRPGGCSHGQPRAVKSHP